MENNLVNIPKEKFEFADKRDISHDKRLETKPRTYMQDAFSRFCKNKGSVVGAIVIIVLVLFAIIVPFCTQYTVAYNDTYYVNTLPRNEWFVNTNFWDGCEAREDGHETFMYYYAMGQETGHNAVKNQEYSVSDDMYYYRLDSYHKTGMIYVNLTREQYADIQNYQNESGRQVIYPTVDRSDRPKAIQDQRDANYYYETEGAYRTSIVYDEDGNVIPVYSTRLASEEATDGYTSHRIEGEEGFEGEDGATYFYNYALISSSGYECRVNYYEYYIYRHSYVLQDGVTSPNFLLGTTGSGQDVLTCLASGARFSFLFAIGVAVVNLIIGAIYGAIEGYYGGKIDLTMERVADILAAIPTMIVITLLKLHMGGSSQIIVLFLAFFLTGWIGMAHTTRMQFYRYKNQEYVLAARTLGAKDRRIIWKHIFPNALGTLVTSCALVIPSMIFSEANLSYLGIINLSTGNITSVGTLIATGQQSLTTAPFIALFPSLFLVLLMLSFNLFGNGLRDAFNPTLRGSEE